MSYDHSDIQAKRKMWRSKRLEENKKNLKKKEIHIRSTIEEKDFLKKQAKDMGLSLSEYILECSLYTVVRKIDFTYLNEFSTHISKIGNNINQIARVLNSLNEKDERLTPSQYAYIQTCLDQFTQAQKRFDDLCSRQWKKLDNELEDYQKIEF